MIPSRYQRIQERAYLMWLQHTDGDSVSFWLQAEELEPFLVWDVPFCDWTNRDFKTILTMIRCRAGFLDEGERRMYNIFCILEKGIESVPIAKIDWKQVAQAVGFPIPAIVNKANTDMLRELAYKCSLH